MMGSCETLLQPVHRFRLRPELVRDLFPVIERVLLRRGNLLGLGFHLKSAHAQRTARTKSSFKTIKFLESGYKISLPVVPNAPRVNRMIVQITKVFPSLRDTDLRNFPVEDIWETRSNEYVRIFLFDL